MSHKFRYLRNPLSLIGAVLVTTSAVLFLVVFLADLFGLHSNPYIGILFFLVLPGVFVVSLLLIPLGAWLARRRRSGLPATELHWPRLDLNDPVQRRGVLIFAVLTLANIVIVSLAAYRGVEYMDSVQFCGVTCHTVMKPEFTAYQDSAHSRVACVQCHIGAGATWFAKSKLSGTRQLFAVAFNTHSRPIPSPVKELRPARDTCETCHWPEKFHGDKLRHVYEYAEDEKNTESSTSLLVHVGGGSERLGIAQGIHWHMNVANQVEYIATDDKRQVIPWVRVKDRVGKVREYRADGITEEQLANGERRTMDCMDCHNRPSHAIAGTPERAVNELMARGDIPKTLPFIRRESVKALKVEYPSQDAAEREIARTLREFYRSTDPKTYMGSRQDVEKAVQATTAIYRRNVFPEMKVQFGTYPNNIGHMDFPGCFRCHDDNHKSQEGKTISQDCETCHKVE
jgi:NapC/NirT cytochrome c family, N-terminal region